MRGVAAGGNLIGIDIQRLIFMAAHKSPNERFKGFDEEYMISLIFETSDWQTALCFGSALEGMLETLILNGFANHPNRTEQAELFSGYGPIATFSAKIGISYAMGLISASTRSDLSQIKLIRNDAAHRTHGFAFTIEEIAKRCSKLSLNQEADYENSTSKYAHRLAKLDRSEPRTKFVLSSLGVMIEMTNGVIFALKNKIFCALATRPDFQKTVRNHPSFLPDKLKKFLDKIDKFPVLSSPVVSQRKSLLSLPRLKRILRGS